MKTSPDTQKVSRNRTFSLLSEPDGLHVILQFSNTSLGKWHRIVQYSGVIGLQKQKDNGVQ